VTGPSAPVLVLEKIFEKRFLGFVGVVGNFCGILALGPTERLGRGSTTDHRAAPEQNAEKDLRRDGNVAKSMGRTGNGGNPKSPYGFRAHGGQATKTVGWFGLPS